jgi:diketogulonate reductase-like aldo/keto reductase
MDPRRRALLGAVAAGALGVELNTAFGQSGGIMTKTIPSTGEALPIVGVGTWQTFDVGADASSRAPLLEVLKLMTQGGRGVVDSSPMYGASESVAGDLMAQAGLHKELFVATKVWTSGRDAGIKQMETSFKRLRVERMDLMQVHNLVDVATHTRTLLDWKAKGRVRYLGVTHYTSSAYAEVERTLKAAQYDFLQINYSLGERDSEKRILPLAAERKTAVIINRPFAEGALFRQVKGKPLPPWAAELGIASWAQYFLKWIVSHPAVTCAIPGTGNPKHMQDNLGAGRGKLPDAATRKKMADYFDGLG